MAKTSIKLYAQDMVIVKQTDPETRFAVDPSTVYSLASDSTSAGVYVLARFDQFPSNLINNRLYEVEGVFAIQSGALHVHPLAADFDPSTVTWSNMPETEGTEGYYALAAGKWSSPDTLADKTVTTSITNTDYNSLCARAFLLNSTAHLHGNGNYAVFFRETLVANTEPYLEVFYDDSTVIQSQITQENCITSGYANPRVAHTFQWTYEKESSSYVCLGDFTQASATFYWKESSAANYTAVAISGTTMSTTIAANTFPTASTIMWYLEGTDTAGTTSQTPVYTISTAAGTVATACVEPVNEVVDGTASNLFTWSITSTDGQPASRTILQWKLSTDNSWTTVFDDNSQITSYTIPGGTFSSGSIDWQVLSYNIDGVLGTYTPSTFICIAAPDAVEALTATAVPYSTISWQSSGQQAFQISIDGEVVTKQFGDDVYSYTLENPLSDGTHTITVMVQGQYGLWSQPSTATVTILNVAPTTITLAGNFALDGELYWEFGTPPVDTSVYVFRDDTMIATVATDDYFPDRMVLGTHSYYILKKYDTGYYAKSNVVTGTMTTSETMMAAISPTGEVQGWLSLGESENSEEEQLFDWNKTATLRHVGGITYPDIELSVFEDLVSSYNCAFNDATSCTRLEGMKGQPVIVKSRRGNVTVGVLIKLTKRETHFYTAYSFSLQQISMEEIVNA